jgi:hypothetical protein
MTEVTAQSGLLSKTRVHVEDTGGPDGPLSQEQAAQMTKNLTEDRDGFFDQFTTEFFSVGGEFKVTEAQRQDAIAMCQQSDQRAALACMAAFGGAARGGSCCACGW